MLLYNVTGRARRADEGTARLYWKPALLFTSAVPTEQVHQSFCKGVIQMHLEDPTPSLYHGVT